ncbi:hypothetical protein LAZ29_01130 [Cereibacter sphaeroides]|uniref:hypothetical protein n=1 Tax=Cereibacter sphaeroides TaxID=1063 RepID=UPI001F43B2CC|nr:hypothetical protein [Cereibacter sphaeroides]MCE6949548.1 hypothetical protein [Cereibacter sphaeroides]
MRQAEIGGFWADFHEILQAMATDTSGFTRKINHFAVVQAGRARWTTTGSVLQIPHDQVIRKCGKRMMRLTGR